MMDSIYAAQNKLRKDLGLSKIRVVNNPNYKPQGIKSYVYLMNRFGFDSTKEGPYHHVHRVKQRGLAHPDFKAALGGRVHRERVLVKKTGTGDDTQTGEVPAEDQQDDTE